MIGNKTDLIDSISINSEMSQGKANFLQVPVMETSALDASNVKEAFYLLIKEMYKSSFDESQNNNGGENVEEGVTLEVEKKDEPKKGCC